MQMMHGRLWHLKQPRLASGGRGRTEGMSSVHRDWQCFWRLRGWGSTCCLLLLVCRMEVCSPVNQLRKGGLEGWCVTMNGALLVLCFGLYCSAWDLGAFFCSHSGYLDVLRAMAAMLELALHLVTASIKDIKRLCRGIAASRIGCRECF